VYTFEFPSEWKIDAINKVEKGTKGIDGRVYNTKVSKKGESAFTIVLGRAGEDDASFKIKDARKTFTGFYGADPGLLETLESDVEIVQKTREAGGYTYNEYEIMGDTISYLVTITVFEGKLFALFVRAPSDKFKKDEAVLRKIQKSYGLTGRTSR